MDHMLSWVLVHDCVTRQMRARRHPRETDSACREREERGMDWRARLRAMLSAVALSR